MAELLYFPPGAWSMPRDRLRLLILAPDGTWWPEEDIYRCRIRATVWQIMYPRRLSAMHTAYRRKRRGHR